MIKVVAIALFGCIFIWSNDTSAQAGISENVNLNTPTLYYSSGYQPKKSWTSFEFGFHLIPPKGQVKIGCFPYRASTCLWYRNGAVVESSDRYKYDNLTRTTDCSINITSLGPLDFDDWSCEAGYSEDFPKMRELLKTVNIQKADGNISTSIETGTHNVLLNRPLHLDCPLYYPTNCSWYRKGRHVASTDKYNYSSINTMDCSIRIASLEQLDLTHWSCKLHYRNWSNKVFKQLWIAEAYGEAAEKTTEFSTQLAYPGNSTQVSCFTEKNITCGWFIRDSLVPSSNFHRYSIDDTNNCTMTITNLTSSDFNEWTCEDMQSQLIVKRVTLEQGPKYQTGVAEMGLLRFVVGSTAQISCTSNGLYACKWFRNQTYIHSSPDYYYKKYYDNECSITIRALKREDFNKWVCMTDDEYGLLLTPVKTVWLTERFDNEYSMGLSIMAALLAIGLVVYCFISCKIAYQCLKRCPVSFCKYSDDDVSEKKKLLNPKNNTVI